MAGHTNCKNYLLQRIFNLINSLKLSCNLHFAWIPGHMGIHGNEEADKLAKDALQQHVSPGKFLDSADLRQLTGTYINALWQEEWDSEPMNKLKEFVTRVTEGGTNNTRNRRQETMMSRLRIGHSWLTHGFLLKAEDAPFCHSCDTNFTIKHILTECIDFKPIRDSYFLQDNLRELFSQVEPATLSRYLTSIGLLSKI